MKRIFLILYLLLLTPLASYGQSLTFDETNYQLIVANTGEEKFINEYLPDGENNSNWTKMIAVHRYPPSSDKEKEYSPRSMAYTLARMTKEGNSEAKVEIFENKARNETMVEIFTWTPTTPSITEFTLFRFQMDPHSQGIRAIQYAFRHYGETSDEFTQTLKDNRTRWLNLLAEFPIPAFIARGQN